MTENLLKLTQDLFHILSYLAQSWLDYIASREQSSAAQSVNNNIQIMMVYQQPLIDSLHSSPML